jgi:hypothetical protein
MGAAKDEVAAVRAEFEAFRARVRAKAIEVAEEQNWCNEGLNEVLVDLGLERTPVDCAVTMEVTLRFDRELTDPDAFGREFQFPVYRSGRGYDTSGGPEIRRRLRELLDDPSVELDYVTVDVEEN